MRKLGLLLGMVMLVRTIQSAGAADVTLKTTPQEPPKEVGESIRKTLQPKAIQLLEGDRPICEFWFRSELPLKSKPESPSKGLSAVGETTLLGVATVGEGRRDYKDNEIAPGTYTIRFGLQPQDGDHLGTSEYPYFAVLIPVKNDAELEGITKYKPMVRASGKGTVSGHPVVMSLRPPSSDSGEIPKLTEPAPGHKAVFIKLPTKAPGEDSPGSIFFELVYEGKYKS